MKNYPKIIIGLILLFHVAITLHSFYTLFADYTGWTLYHYGPFMMLIFTLVWLGIFLKKRVFAMIYFSLILFELSMKLFFGKYLFGEIFGKVFFPADVLFIFVVILFYRQHFGDRSAT